MFHEPKATLLSNFFNFYKKCNNAKNKKYFSFVFYRKNVNSCVMTINYFSVEVLKKVFNFKS